MKPFETLTDDELHHQLQRAVQALPDAPLHLQRAAIGLWPAAPAGAASGVASGAVLGVVAAARTALAQIAAVLSFDSWAVPAVAVGMRSLRSPTRHLLFSAQGRDIDLRISPSPVGSSEASNAFVMAGQVLGPDESGSVQLTALQAGATGARQTLLTALDEMGEFRIEGLAPGSYALTLQVGDDAIVLPPLQVGGPEVDSTA
jgi:hypothetical protein